MRPPLKLEYVAVSFVRFLSRFVSENTTPFYCATSEKLTVAFRTGKFAFRSRSVRINYRYLYLLNLKRNILNRECVEGKKTQRLILLNDDQSHLNKLRFVKKEKIIIIIIIIHYYYKSLCRRTFRYKMTLAPNPKHFVLILD